MCAWLGILLALLSRTTKELGGADVTVLIHDLCTQCLFYVRRLFWGGCLWELNGVTALRRGLRQVLRWHLQGEGVRVDDLRGLLLCVNYSYCAAVCMISRSKMRILRTTKNASFHDVKISYSFVACEPN